MISYHREGWADMRLQVHEQNVRIGEASAGVDRLDGLMFHPRDGLCVVPLKLNGLPIYDETMINDYDYERGEVWGLG